MATLGSERLVLNGGLLSMLRGVKLGTRISPIKLEKTASRYFYR